MASLLLDKGAEVDVKNKNGLTPLHIGFRIHNPSTSTPQLLTLNPSTLHSLNPLTINPLILHPQSSPFTLLLTQYMYPNPLTLSLNTYV